MVSRYRAIVIGTSAGGLETLMEFLPALPAEYPLPLIIVQHLAEGSDRFLPEYLNRNCRMNVEEAADKQLISNSTIYIAPPGYHLLVESDLTFSLSADEKVNYTRPSIDVLFHSAADVFTDRLAGIVLTGANSDGADGLRKIKSLGGLTIVQDPVTARVSRMPEEAIKATEVDYILKAEELSDLLISLATDKEGACA